MPGERKNRPASLVIRDLMEGNAGFFNNHNMEYFEKFRDTQTPEVTIVTCADARVQTDLFGLDPTNEIFVIRNIGNQVIPVFGSVDYGVIHLKTPVLLIMGHTHCGAMKAVLSDYDGEPFDIIRELDHLSIPVRHIKHSMTKMEDVWLEAVENNVDYQIRLAVKKYSNFIEAGRLTVVGAVDDFINAYGQGDGRVVIININGLSGVQVLKKHPALKDLSPEMLGICVQRS